MLPLRRSGWGVEVCEETAITNEIDDPENITQSPEQAQVAPRITHGFPPFWFAFLGVVAADQFTKWLAINFFSQTRWPIIGKVIENKGIAFGLLAHLGWLTVPIAIFVTIGAFVQYLRIRRQDYWTDIGLGLLVGGASSNLFDRLFRGHVIDFIDFQVWPVFNLADTSITIAVALLIWRALRDEGT